MKKSIGSGRGSVYNILLKALQTGDKYGYEICKEIEEKTNGAYILKQPSLYSGLKRLEAQNLISSYWRDSDLGGRRHYYSLTESGKEKIENSTFSWEDTRTDIVNSLFEKSELDNELECVASEIETIKQENQTSETLQNDIDDIIKSTESLAERNDNISQPSDDGDLFSMFLNFSENSEDLSSEESPQKENNENIQYDFEENKDVQLSNSENTETFNVSANVENFNTAVSEDYKKEEFKQSSDVNLEQSEIINLEEQTEENENIENIENTEETVETNSLTNASLENHENTNTDEQLDLFSFVNTKQTEDTLDEQTFVQGEEEIEENKIENYQDIIDNFTTVNYSTNSQNSTNLQEDKTDFSEHIEEETNKEIELIEQSESSFLENNTPTDNTLQKSTEDYIANYKNDNSIGLSFSDDYKMQTNEPNTYSNYAEDFGNNFFSMQFDIDEEENKQEIVENIATDNLNNFNQNTSEDNASQSTDLSQSVINNYASTPYPNNDQSSYAPNNLNKFGQSKTVANNKSETLLEDDTNKVDATQYEKLNYETNVSEEPQTINYKNIFGDMVANENFATGQAYNFSNENNSTNLTNQPVWEQNEIETPEDLPRITPKYNDVNITLVADEDMLNEANSYNENPFERFDKINNDYYEQQNNGYNNVSQTQDTQQQTIQENLPFDKKYAKYYSSFEVPDYQIKYHKKTIDTKPTHSKFISINKLNFANSIIVSLMIILFTTISLCISTKHTTLSNLQCALYVISYVIAVTLSVASLIIYALDKNKKKSEISQNSYFYNIFFAIFIVTLALAINIFYGMELANISSYSASFILPICYALIVLVQPILRKSLSKLSYFYLD